jgi:hypothetical protein
MIAVTRYNLALLGHSQRYIPATVAFLFVIALQYGDRRSPLLPEFAVSGGALLAVSCWLTVALLDVEDPVQRLITLSHTRRLWPIIGGAVLTVFVCAVVMTLGSEGWAVYIHRAATAGELVLGALAHFACACTGIAIGLPCSRLVIGRLGWSVLIAIIVLVGVVLAPWIPLVHPMLRVMAADETTAGSVIFGLVASLLVLAVSALAVGVTVRRRS